MNSLYFYEKHTSQINGVINKSLFLITIVVSLSVSAQSKVTRPSTGSISEDVGNSDSPHQAGAGGANTIPQTTIDLNNVRANQWIQSYEDFQRQRPQSPIVDAARATVQLIPKCAVGRLGHNRFYIGQHSPMPFCNGNPNHPLSSGGSATSQNETQRGNAIQTYDGSSPCGGGLCSGSLVSNQQTIATAAHCLAGKSPADFCKDYVIVFNRSGSRTEFSNNDVFECEGGISVDTSNGQNVNFNSDGQGFKDHAFLRIKASTPVPESTARALELSERTPQAGDTFYAVGHPDGNPRTVSPISYTVSPSRNGYNYIQGTGYVYQGNSGGPLLDSSGRLAGILASADDLEFGVPGRREPKVRRDGENGICRTQIATSTITVESIGFGRELRSQLQTLGGEPTATPDDTDIAQ